MYSDPVFLLVVLAAFILLERRMYWAAGLVGVLATAGRPVGLAVTVGLVVADAGDAGGGEDEAHHRYGSAHRPVARTDNSGARRIPRCVRIPRSGRSWRPCRRSAGGRSAC